MTSEQEEVSSEYDDGVKPETLRATARELQATQPNETVQCDRQINAGSFSPQILC